MDVSIIIPVYNSGAHVDRIKTSIAPFFNAIGTEIIVIDDVSTDDTVERIEKLIVNEDVNNLILLKNRENKGPSFTRNQGLKRAKGEYIAFLDADDAWHASKIDFQIKLMKKYGVFFCGTEHLVITEKIFKDVRVKALPAECEVESVSWPKILFKTPFATPSVILHKNLKHYLFDEQLRYGEDYHLWIRMAHDYDALKIKYPLTYTFKHDYLAKENSLSSKLWSMQQGNFTGFIKLLSAWEYGSMDKVFITAALVFSFLKFIKRGMKKISFSLWN